MRYIDENDRRAVNKAPGRNRSRKWVLHRSVRAARAYAALLASDGLLFRGILLGQPGAQKQRHTNGWYGTRRSMVQIHSPRPLLSLNQQFTGTQSSWSAWSQARRSKVQVNFGPTTPNECLALVYGAFAISKAKTFCVSVYTKPKHDRMRRTHFWVVTVA